MDCEVGNVKQMKAILAAFDASDLPIALLIVGLALIGYGASQFHHGLGAIFVGALIVLYIKPLSRWVK